MSASLLKKSLDLCDSPFETVQNLEVSDTGRKQAKTQRGAGDVSTRNIESIEKVKRSIHKKKKDRLKALDRLQALKQPVIDDKISQIILQGTRAGDSEHIIRLKEPEKSVFTEEDFIKFEKEYFEGEKS